MAKITPLASKIFKWEDGFVNDPIDHGGPTNRGVTLSTWQKVGYGKDGDSDLDVGDIRLLTPDDALAVLKTCYWDRWHADEIENQKVANILVDWLWCSGKWGILIPQRILGVPVDGIVGPVTIQAVNRSNPYRLIIQIYNTRVTFILDIIKKNPSQKRFEKGWFNRLNAFL